MVTWTTEQLKRLLHLYESDKRVTQKMLAEQFNCSQNNISVRIRQAKELRARGWPERVPSEHLAMLAPELVEALAYFVSEVEANRSADALRRAREVLRKANAPGYGER